MAFEYQDLTVTLLMVYLLMAGLAGDLCSPEVDQQYCNGTIKFPIKYGQRTCHGGTFHVKLWRDVHILTSG